MAKLLCLLLPLLLVTSAFGQETAKVRRRSPQPQVRYALGPDSLPQADVPQGRLEGPFLFHSKIIENTVRKYWVHVPAQYDASEPACVLVFQDGARAINPDGVIRVPQVLDNLIAKKQIPVTIGIFITPGQRGDVFPDDIGTGNPDNRDREYDVLDDKYARFIVEEMLPEVGKKYNLTNDPRGRAIGGSSSGGICAFTVAWHKPDEFRNVVSFIGSFTNIHGGHVYPELVRQTPKKHIRIFLQDGVNDLRSPNNLERDWHIPNQKMVAAFQEQGYDMAHVFGAGGHSDDHGGAMLPEMLRWIWRDYPGIDEPDVDLVAKAAAIEPIEVDLFPGFDDNGKVDPTGRWTWSRGGRFRMSTEVAIENSGDGWTGTYTTTRGEGEENTTSLKNVTLEGNKLTFDVERSFNDTPCTITYQGLVRPNEIVGWSMMEFNGSPRDREWVASRKDPEAILLWPDGAPGAVANGGAENVRVTGQGERVISNVHNPSLTPYIPSASASTGAAVIIAPGGGHRELWSDHEGHNLGKWLQQRGVAAFVLKYRLAEEVGSEYTVDDHALADLQRSVRLVRSRANQWNVAADSVGVLGFSAGGELVALSGMRFDMGDATAEDEIEQQSCRPDFAALIYPGRSRRYEPHRDSPPVFIACGYGDRPDISKGMAEVYLKYKDVGVPAELHIYSDAGHGFGVRERSRGAAAKWPQRFVEWLADQDMLKSGSKRLD